MKRFNEERSLALRVEQRRKWRQECGLWRQTFIRISSLPLLCWVILYGERVISMDFIEFCV